MRASLRIAFAVVLAASIVFGHDDMELTIFVDPEDVIAPSPEAFAAAHACPYVAEQGVTPTPFTIQRRKLMPSGALMPDPKSIIRGTLERCI
jgi:hypothetical protein